MKLKDINKRSIRRVSNQELLMLHYRLHQLYSLNHKNKRVAELIVEKHKIVVAEMLRRGMKHNPKDLLDKTLLEIHQEAKATSIVRVSRKEKVSRAIGTFAIQMAKEKNDPLYKRYEKFRRKYLDAKERIIKKYAPRVRSKARRSVMSSS